MTTTRTATTPVAASATALASLTRPMQERWPAAKKSAIVATPLHEELVAQARGPLQLVFAAVGLVVQLKEALNVVWEVKPKARGGIWGFARNYVLSLAGVLTIGFLLLVFTGPGTFALDAMGGRARAGTPHR